MKGMPTGLHDDNGEMICVGDIVRKPVTGNKEIHGEWSLSRVVLRGLTPILSYVRSEKGDILPEGYLAQPLSDRYDRKMFLFMTNLDLLTPCDGIVIEDRAERWLSVPTAGLQESLEMLKDGNCSVNELRSFLLPELGAAIEFIDRVQRVLYPDKGSSPSP